MDCSSKHARIIVDEINEAARKINEAKSLLAAACRNMQDDYYLDGDDDNLVDVIASLRILRKALAVDIVRWEGFAAARGQSIVNGRA